MVVLSPLNFAVELAIGGEIISTKSHSEDGIVLVLDSCEAFIWDLLHENFTLELNDHKSIEDRKSLRRLGARKFFRGHYISYELGDT